MYSWEGSKVVTTFKSSNIFLAISLYTPEKKHIECTIHQKFVQIKGLKIAATKWDWSECSAVIIYSTEVPKKGDVP